MTDDRTTGRTLSEVMASLPEERRKAVEFRWHYLSMQEALRGDWIRKPDYDAKVQECEAMRHDLSILRQHHHEGCMAEIDRLRGLLAAANERAGKLNRQLVELQDVIDSRDKAAGFCEVPYRPAQTVVWMIEQEFDTAPTEFWTGVGVTGWSRSALDGVRFAYKEDAERVLRYVLGGNRRYVREHIWIDAALAADSGDERA